MSSTTISAQAFSQKKKDGEISLLIDVRTAMEFQEVHLLGAFNIPLDQLTKEKVEELERTNGVETSKDIFLICKGGGRGQQACQKLEGMGREYVINVDGGTMACIEAGLPVTRGAKHMSLERQVRIAAGSLVVLGILLSYFVHPDLLGISGFVGAGLVFAGVTDTCGMGMMLARMPWNQKR